MSFSILITISSRDDLSFFFSRRKKSQ